MVAVVSTVAFNMVYLIQYVPEIPLHENRSFFSEDGHMYRASASAAKTANDTLIADRNNINNNNKNNNNINNNEENQKSIRDLLLEEAGVELTPEMEANLPTWSQVREVVGSAPVLLGLESCPKFRETVPPLERMLGAAGMFNTGTNLVTRLLKENCEIPERRQQAGPHTSKEKYGMRWQVPWGKHTPVKFRNEHSTRQATAINKDYILPVVTIRHPYSWFGSMCKNQYTATWDHTKTKKESNNGMPTNCPVLKQGSGAPTAPWNPVTVTFAEERKDHHLSLAHLWNDWYSYYIDGKGGDFPFLVIRMEDLVFYPKETLHQVCECAGGKIRTDQPFQFITDSAKGDSKGHDTSTGIYEAWIKYSKPNTKETYGFPDADYANARFALNGTLMESLGYQHPSSS